MRKQEEELSIFPAKFVLCILPNDKSLYDIGYNTSFMYSFSKLELPKNLTRYSSTSLISVNGIKKLQYQQP